MPHARVVQAQHLHRVAVVALAAQGERQHAPLAAARGLLLDARDAFATDQLGERGFRVLLATAVPPNDGGLSYGQVAEFLGRLR